MFKRDKLVTVCTWSDLQAEKVAVQEVKKTLPAAVLGTSLLLATSPAAAEGYVKGAITNKVMDAFAPLVDFVQVAAYPIAGFMMSLGCIVYMAGNRTRGGVMIKSAAFGFVLIQFVPVVMEILVGVSDAMSVNG